ncbi:MAG: PEP/pyruvate-binding domain-containing protein [Candidatus Entotheonellia bacterium]
MNWPQAYEAGLRACGGKGYHLAKLQRYGFPVPDGGVVVADVYRQLMQAPVLAAHMQAVSTLRAEDVTAPMVQEQLAHLQQGITAAVLPAQVSIELEPFLREHHLAHRAIAVRSSAMSEDGPSASFAGMHQSVLNVQGVDAICRAILQCFASLWTPQAVAYRRRMAFADDDVVCAAVLCAMVTTPGGDEPQSAGVAFSCDPRTGRRDLIIINAARGSGAPVVSGALDPDHIEIRLVRDQLYLHNRNTRGTPALSPGRERELAHHVWRIHWALGDGDHPQDVEWAHDGAQFWILQARPVTRLPRYTFEAIKHLPVIWSTANIKDAVPGVVSTFAWSMIQEAIDGVLYAGPRLVGYEIPPGMQSVKRIDGHAYFDLTAIQWCWFDLVGALPAQTVATIGGHQPEIPVPPGDPLSGPVGRRRQNTRLKVFWRMVGFNRRFRRVLQEHVAAVRDIAAVPWEQLSNDAMLGAIARMVELHERLDPLVGFSNGYASTFKELLEAQLFSIVGEHAPALMARLLAGSGEVTSAEQGYRIVDLARAAQGDPEALAWLQRREAAQAWEELPSHSPFRRALARFLGDFGHRAVYEADVINPRWRDDPGYILDQVRRMLDTRLDGDPRLAARRVSAAAWAEVKRLTFWRRPLLRWLVGRVQRGFALREAGKSGMVASLWPTRRLLLEIGRRLVAARQMEQPEHVFHLSKADLLGFLRGHWDGHGADALAQDRAVQREAWLQLTPPDVVVEGEGADDVVSVQEPSPAFDGQMWRGIGVSSGRVTAVARTIRHPDEGMRLGHGEILVAPSTDPGWTPLFLRASAVVMETGGYLSHGAIVAREYGLPAVVNVPGILRHIKDGETLTVDGDAATVSRIP